MMPVASARPPARQNSVPKSRKGFKQKISTAKNSNLAKTQTTQSNINHKILPAQNMTHPNIKNSNQNSNKNENNDNSKINNNNNNATIHLVDLQAQKHSGSAKNEKHNNSESVKSKKSKQRLSQNKTEESEDSKEQSQAKNNNGHMSELTCTAKGRRKGLDLVG